MSNKTSQHIINTSANLLGFCLIVITSLHISNHFETSIVDELTLIISFILIGSCLFSFFSIKTKNPKSEQKFESIADYLFIGALIGIVLIILLIALNFI